MAGAPLYYSPVGSRFGRTLGRVWERRTAVAREATAIGEEEAQVHDQFDIELEDAELLGEVELTTNLIIAASEAEEHLSPEQIDEILGIEPPVPPLAPHARTGS